MKENSYSPIENLGGLFTLLWKGCKLQGSALTVGPILSTSGVASQSPINTTLVVNVDVDLVEDEPRCHNIYEQTLYPFRLVTQNVGALPKSHTRTQGFAAGSLAIGAVGREGHDEKSSLLE